MPNAKPNGWRNPSNAAGLPLRILRADAYPLRELKTERYLYVVISTQGDGDPPDDARGFVEFLASRRAPRLDDLQFRRARARRFELCEILCRRRADRCATGRTRRAPVVAARGHRCRYRNRRRAVAHRCARTRRATTCRYRRRANDRHAIARVAPPIAWHRERPFSAEVLANQRISASGSAKDIRHIELSLRDSGLSYEPGDSLGVWPSNPPQLVAAILDVTRLDGQTDRFARRPDIAAARLAARKARDHAADASVRARAGATRAQRRARRHRSRSRRHCSDCSPRIR